MEFLKVTIFPSSKLIQKKVYVVKNLVISLLGKPAIFKFGLVSSVDKIQTDSDWRSKFPKLFHGLRTMESETKIRLDDCIC